MIEALTEISCKTAIEHPVIGEINKAKTQEIRAHTTTGHEASDRTNNTKIKTDHITQIKQTVVVTGTEIIQIQLGISGHQIDPRITLGAVKMIITTIGMGKTGIIRNKVQITMAGMAKAEWNAGTAMGKIIIIIIIGMEDLTKVLRIKIFNKREVVKTIDIPKVDRIDDK